MKFSDSISKQILEAGISLDEVENQISLLQKGTTVVNLVSSATIVVSDSASPFKFKDKSFEVVSTSLFSAISIFDIGL